MKKNPPVARVPSLATLKKYGLTEEEWKSILHGQGGGCAVCRRIPKSGRLCIDHDHVRGWKKMDKGDRKKYIRGILCFFCNHYYMGRCINVFKARNVYNYLVRYELRKAQS